MTTLHERFVRQERWNHKGTDRLAKMASEPERFLITKSPHERSSCQATLDLMQALGPLVGKRVLELGCGRGEFAVFLAKQGAHVTGIDIGPELTATSTALAELNDVSCRFVTSNITQLPFDDHEFDVVIGIDVLHHLLEADLKQAIAECHRVLKDTGRAFVIEPVENSRTFSFIQDLIPVGTKAKRDYRPSVLQRAAWKEYVENNDQRSLTNAELVAVGSSFRSVSVRPYGFLIRLHRLLGKRTKRPLMAIDKALFRAFPPLTHLCRRVLVEYRR